MGDVGRVGHRRPLDGWEVSQTDGPDSGAKEQIGGFWLIAAGDRDAAVAWGRKGAAAREAPVDVRPMQGA